MTIAIAKLLDRQKYDVKFVVIGQRIGEIKEFIPDGYPLSLIKIRNIFDFTTLRLFNLLRRERPHYVFCSLMYLNPRVIQAAEWVGNCKIIVRFNCAVNRVSGITKYLTKKTYNKADVVIAQTERMQEELEKAYHLVPGKVVTMHNMLDTETIRRKLEEADNPYPNDGNKRYVWVGRFDRVKCVEVAVKAFVEAYKTDSRISLYVVGKYNESSAHYQEVLSLLHGEPAGPNVHFVGFQSNPYKWMKYADCFLLSSSTEASPNALFEALYLGIPVVATRCTPNIDDIVSEGENGYAVKVGDVSGMAEKMLYATELKDVKPIYHHSMPTDFIKLFN